MRIIVIPSLLMKLRYVFDMYRTLIFILNGIINLLIFINRRERKINQLIIKIMDQDQDGKNIEVKFLDIIS